jgi:formylglycine-generating enzyme required for sulfatase activity
MNKRDCTLGAALCAAQLLAASHALANNIQVSGVTLQSIDTTADTAMVQFNLSWENSWRVATGPANYDAAWVFVKYHTGDQIWKSAGLDITDAMHSVPAAATLDVGLTGTRGMGAFIYRSGTGSGNVNYANIRLKWNYGADGVSDAALVTLDVHAVEMVFIPSGAFQAGDGGARAGAAETGTFGNGVSGTPFTITANTVPAGTTAGSLGATGLTAVIAPAAYRPVPATFPTGFDPYYMMKYEGSQGQWAAFVNTTVKLPVIPYQFFETQSTATPPLPLPPKDFLTGRQVFFSADLPPPAIIPFPFPNGTIIPTTPTRPIVQSQTPNRAFVANPVQASPAVTTEVATLAYLDWSGLRPMTEFEYEKAARGPVAPVLGEFAWGTTEVALLGYGGNGAGTSLSNEGLASEGPLTNYNETGGNAWTRATVTTLAAGGPILGPARVGMFARPAYNPPTPPRIQSGAGYFGVMDLTGNVSELVARWTFPSSATAALFSAEHGDGLLGTNGQANVAAWTAVAPATFFGLRGGSFAEQPIPVSVRSALTGAAASMANPGIRGVRSAPVTGP